MLKNISEVMEDLYPFSFIIQCSKWCRNATKQYFRKKEDIANFIYSFILKIFIDFLLQA